MWVDANAEREVTFRASLGDVYALLADVPKSGVYFPGIERIETLGDDRYRWILEERSTLGITFKGTYVVKYDNNGKDVVRWSTESGNMESGGEWRLSETAGGVFAKVKLTNKIEVPVPRLLQKPVRLFASREVGGGLDIQIKALKGELRG